ncbi:hypothetical protein BH160DRAFT_1797 [Burkholderia sp. H160]|nr:hypothetical protein BH160DRAFT_1797 [Burkholderia sp. H160]
MNNDRDKYRDTFDLSEGDESRAYGYRGEKYFFLKIRAAFLVNPR